MDWPNGWTRPEDLPKDWRKDRIRSYGLMRLFNFKEPEPSGSFGSYANDDPVTHWENANHDIEVLPGEGDSIMVECVTGWGDMFISKFYPKAKKTGGEYSSKYTVKGVTVEAFTDHCISVGLRVRGVNERL